MTMPIDFMLVRHGQSEQNQANRMFRKGQGHEVPDEYYDRHSSTFRLTDRGIRQAQATGAWIRENFPLPFGKYFCSEYIRAMETAGHLRIPDARWYRDFRLRERDWGDLDVVREEERHQRFAENLKKRSVDSFFWKPSNGESIADLCLRLRAPLATLHKTCADTSAIWVCHGEVMWAMRVILERLTQSEWAVLDSSENAFDTIHNGQILHYTRRDPDTGELSPYVKWMRSILPEDMTRSPNVWTPIIHRSYSSEDLLAEVERIPRMVHDNVA